MARSVVTVGEFPNAMLAELARGRLEEEGIEAEVSGAMAQTWAGGDVPLFGVKVEVRREDADRARAILSAIEAGGDSSPEGPQETPASDEALDDEVEDDVPGEAPDAAEAAESSPDGGWPPAKAARATRDALVVSLLSWVFLPLIILSIVMLVRVPLHRGTAPWTPRMRVTFGFTVLHVLALTAYSVYVVLTDAWYWFVPWPWFRAEAPLPPPE